MTSTSFTASEGSDRLETTTEIVERLPLGPMQFLVLGLAFAITMADGADLLMLAFAAPAIIADWNVSKAAFTPALSAALIGMIFGALAGGYFGDRAGRKRTLLVGVLIMGVATIITGMATNLTELTIIRFIAGIGFGAVTPTAYALGVEVLPQRSRTWASAVFCFVTALGGVVGSLLALAVIPAYGWPVAFYSCGALSLAIGLLIYLFAPESSSFLFAKGETEKAEASFRYTVGKDRLPAQFSFLSQDVTPETEAQEAPTLFSSDFIRTTLGAWLVYFSTAFMTYACLNWLPTILTSNQWPYEFAVQVGGVISISAIIGTLIVAVGVQFIGTRAFMLLGSLASVGAACWLPFLIQQGLGSSHSASAIMFASALLGYASGSLLATSLAVVGGAYPVTLRSRGVGYALSFARIGSTVATLSLGGILYISNDNLFAFFGVVAFVAALIAVGGMIINRQVPGRLVT